MYLLNRNISSLSYCEVGTHITGRHAPLTINNRFCFLCRRGDIEKGRGRHIKHITAAVSRSHGELLFLLQEGRPDSDSATERGLWCTQQEVISPAHVGHQACVWG